MKLQILLGRWIYLFENGSFIREHELRGMLQGA
jgi:hypothetical protein